MFPEARATEEVSAEAIELARCLREQADSIARRSTAALLGGLPLLGGAARRRLRRQLVDQVLELARHLESFGAEGPRLYGESQRRYAAARLAEGMSLDEALEERAVVQDAIIDAWTETRGPLPRAHARLLADSFAEVTSQTAEVWLTYQRAESVAFQEAALLDTIVHNLDEAILVVEPDGVVSYATPAFETILKLPARLLIGVPPEKLEGITARLDVRDREGNPIPRSELPHLRALRTGQVQHEEFVHFRRMDGTEAVCEMYAAPVFAEDGILRGAVLTLRDRTQLFEQTEALQQAYDELRLMHTRLLSRSRLEAIGELAGSTAHALNNQLNVITLRLRRLLDLPEAKEDAAAIERSVREIADLVGRLQEFAAAPRPEHPRPIHPAPVVSTALDLVRAQLGPAGDVGLEVRFMEEPPTVVAERDTLLEFLTALLLGARDATPAGESVLVETGLDDGVYVIRIVDRGPELTETEVEQLFEPLRADAAERALNLSIGRQAVQRWGGEVRILPAEGGGNAFEVRLRVEEEAAREAVEEAAVGEKAAASAPAAATGAAPAHTVLVVDDDADNAAMLADLVRDAGASPTTASTGAEGIARAESLRPEAALVDLLLPDMKGWTVVEELKKRQPDIRIAVVSGLAVPREEREAHGADAVFRKPIDTDELLSFLGL